MARRRKRSKLQRIGDWLTLALVAGAVGSASFIYLRWVYREQRYNKLIEEISARQGVEKFLIKGVIRQESGFDPFAYSKADAIGLMQVTEAAGWDWASATGRRDFSRGMLWNERINLEAGTWYLRRALEYWGRRGVDDPVPFALAEYNAGRGNVQRWLTGKVVTNASEFVAVVPLAGVRHYVNRVRGYRDHYAATGKL
jgi:soluble lytic murein transglycosylase